MEIPRTIKEKSKAVRSLANYFNHDELFMCENDNNRTKERNMGCEYRNGLRVSQTDALISNHVHNNGDMLNSSSSSISDDVDINSDCARSDSSSPSEVTNPSERALLRMMNGMLCNQSPPVNQAANFLPPIGVFWDIENCQVPKGRSAVLIAQAVREKFFHGYREAEFLVVCDVKKENVQVIQELNDAQVNLVHVGSVSKNAADDKLRQSMRRFADIHGSPSAIVLISGDINFSSDLSDLRHRKKIHIILLHNDLCSQSLILCANEHYNYTELVETLPLRGCENNRNVPVEVFVRNLPLGYDPAKIRNRLKRLSENCGGRVGIIDDQTTTIRFPSFEMATRAQKRMNKEWVYGCEVSLSPPYPVGNKQDTTKFKGKKNYWKFVEDSNSFQEDSTTMYNFADACNGNKQRMESPFQFNQGFPPYRLGLSPPNGRFANGYTYRYPNINQENMMNTNIASPPPWNMWHTHKMHVNGQYNGGGKNRSALTTYNNNTHLSEMSETSTLEYSWQATGRCSFNSFPLQQLPIPSDQNENRTPQVKILKRNSASAPPKNSHTPQSQGPIEFQADTTPTIPINKRSFQKSYNGVIERFPHGVVTSNAVNGFDNGLNDNNKNGLTHDQSIELHITNLDQSMNSQEMKVVLLTLIREYSPIIHSSIYTQSDGNYAAIVKLPNLDAAHYVISKLHRKKIGYKRIVMAFNNSFQAQSANIIRPQVLSLLLEVPGNQLPLFKFRELFEKRYFTTASVSDLYKMKEICAIYSNSSSSGRIISLNPEHRNSPSPVMLHSPLDSDKPPDQPYCAVHWKPCKSNSGKGWAELEISALPNVFVPLREFTVRVYSLIKSHNNYLLLASFCDCYEAEFGSLLDVGEEDGVPLEHMVTCVPGIELVQNTGTAVKYLTTSDNAFINNGGVGFEEWRNDSSSGDNAGKCGSSSSLSHNVALFSRELVDLLKTFPRCMMSFNRFIPSYHHHFGRQCRVADYGYTKLIDLLEALPLVVQVLGDGNKKFITLSHRAQVRRFTSDLLRVLKSSTSKQAFLTEFPSLFEKVLNKTFRPIDYGLTSLADLLSQVSENTVVVNNVNRADCVNTIISIPKREQTPDEIERTKTFSSEVIELMSHAPQCSMLFNRFIPAYHHHYGHQCRVSDFGFTKLIELFEAIPEVIKIDDDPEGERRISLQDNVKLKVLGEQLASLVMVHQPAGLLLRDLDSAFLWQFGYSLKPVCYGFEDIESLIQNLQSYVKVINTSKGPMLQAVDKKQLKFLSLKVRRVLMECSNTGRMNYEDFQLAFKSLFGEYCGLEKLEMSLSDTVSVARLSDGNVHSAVVKLVPIQMFARDVYRLLLSGDGRLPFSQFDNAFLKAYGTVVQPSVFGYQSSISLLQSISHTVHLRGKHQKRFLLLNNELSYVGIQMPRGFNSSIYQNNFDNYSSIASSSTSIEDLSSTSSGGKIEDELDPFSQTSNNCFAIATNSDEEQIPSIILPNLTLHPDTFTSSPLTSPHKSLRNTVMFVEHMLHAPACHIMSPSSDKIPLPPSKLLFETDDILKQQNNFIIADSISSSSISNKGGGSSSSSSSSSFSSNNSTSSNDANQNITVVRSSNSGGAADSKRSNNNNNITDNVVIKSGRRKLKKMVASVSRHADT